MYRQILICPEDRLYQHILWRDFPEDDVKEFELMTVTYGLNSAPYENSTDPAFRGLLSSAMVSSKLHWNGSDFLCHTEDSWSVFQFIPLQLDQLPEFKACAATSFGVCTRLLTMEFFQRFSSLQIMLRVVSCWVRFTDCLRKHSFNNEPVSLVERNRTLIIVILRTQEAHFSYLLKQLTARKLVP